MIDTKQRLIEAAGPIFASRGFAEATVREICDSASVNLAAVSYHFGDKRGLYLATVEFARQWLNEQSPIEEMDQPVPAETRLAIFVRGLLQRLMGTRSDSWHMELLNREILNPTEACEQVIKQHFSKRFKELKSIIAELAEADLPEHELEQLVFAVTGQCFHYHMAGRFIGLMTKDTGTQEHYRIDRLAEQITRFSLAGIRRWNTYREHPVAVFPPAFELMAAASSQGDSSLESPNSLSYPWSNELNGSSQDDA